MGDIVPYVFKHKDIEAEVRTFTKGGLPWFVATDACRALDIQFRGLDSLRSLRASEKGIDFIDTLGGRQKVVIVSQQGLLRLVLRSDKPYAQDFQDWIIYDVVPQICETGSYRAPSAPVTHSDLVKTVEAGVVKGIERILPPMLGAIANCAKKDELQCVETKVDRLSEQVDLLTDEVSRRLGSRQSWTKEADIRHRHVNYMCFGGCCPLCGRSKILDNNRNWINMEKDHLNGRHNGDFWNTIPLCKECHGSMGRTVSGDQVLNAARMVWHRAETLGIRRPSLPINFVTVQSTFDDWKKNDNRKTLMAKAVV